MANTDTAHSTAETIAEMTDDQKEALWRTPFADEWLDFIADAKESVGSGEAMIRLSERHADDPRWKVYHRAYHLVRKNEGPEGRMLNDLITETEIVYAKLMRKLKERSAGTD